MLNGFGILFSGSALLLFIVGFLLVLRQRPGYLQNKATELVVCHAKPPFTDSFGNGSKNCATSLIRVVTSVSMNWFICLMMAILPVITCAVLHRDYEQLFQD